MRRAFSGLTLVLTAGLTLACVSGRDIDELSLQIADVQRQVLQLQQDSSSKTDVSQLSEKVASQTDALLRSEADMMVGLDQLSQQIEQLQASLGDTNYRLSQLSQQITATNQELQAVRNSIGGALPGPSSNPMSRPPEDPRALYQAAYNDYLSGKYDLAIRGFRQYLESFAGTDQADNAVYWIGESYFSQGRYQQAVQEFDRVLTAYDGSDKTPSALLKKGYAYLELGQRQQGVVQLQSVIRQFPQTDEADLARQRLQTLGVDGG